MKGLYTEPIMEAV